MRSLTEELFQQGYRKGRAISELTCEARMLLAMNDYFQRTGEEKVREYLRDLPKQSKEFLNEALEIASKYPNYTLKHLSKKVIFEATRLPYNFEEYENWKEQMRKESVVYEKENNTGSNV